MEIEKISLKQEDFDKINKLINKICQDIYSETEVIPTGTKAMLRSAIIENLDKYNNMEIEDEFN